MATTMPGSESDRRRQESVIRELAARFAGRQLYLVGGSVRDELLGGPAQDLDFATDCLPEEIKRRVRDWADDMWTVGEKFGTIGLRKGGIKAEITTFRSESYPTATRHPIVRFEPDLRGDLARRDFTVNAMARAVPRGEVIDPFGGQQDLERRRIRFVGDPDRRIAEDPLRMLRAARFSAKLGFEVDETGLTSIREHAAELRRISFERIRDEFEGILLCERPSLGIRLTVDLGMAHFFLPELETLRVPQPSRYHLKDVFEHTLDAVEFTPEERGLRWAALLHDIAKPETLSEDESGLHFYRHEDLGASKAEEVLARLRVPSEVITRVAKLVRHHLRIPAYRREWSAAAVRRLMYDLGGDLEAAIALSVADVKASDPSDYDEFADRIGALRERVAEVGQAEEIARMRPLLDGNEIMALLAIPPGPLVGEIRQYLLDRQIEGEIQTEEQATESVLGRYGRTGAQAENG